MKRSDVHDIARALRSGKHPGLTNLDVFRVLIRTYFAEREAIGRGGQRGLHMMTLGRLLDLTEEVVTFEIRAANARHKRVIYAEDKLRRIGVGLGKGNRTRLEEFVVEEDGATKVIKA
jgi:hypothetical protein